MTRRNNPDNRAYLTSLYKEFNKRKNFKNLNNFLGELEKSILTLRNLHIPKKEKAYFKKQSEIIKKAENGNERCMALLNKAIEKEAYSKKSTNGNGKNNNLTIKMIPGRNGSSVYRHNNKSVSLCAVH